MISRVATDECNWNKSTSDGAGSLAQPAFDLSIQSQDHRIGKSEFLGAIQDQFGFGELSCNEQPSALLEEFARSRSRLCCDREHRAEIKSERCNHQCRNARAIVLPGAPLCLQNDDGSLALERVDTGISARE